MNDSAKATNLEPVARILLKLICRREVSAAEYELAADHFYGGHAAADARSFRKLTDVVVQQLPGNPALGALAAEHQDILEQPEAAGEAWARHFIDRYVDGLSVETLFSQPVMVGYAPRIAGSPYDVAVEQIDGIAGWMMLYCVEGEGAIDTGMRRLTMQPGHVALFAPGAVMSYARAPACPVWGHYWVTFHAAQEWREWLDWPKAGPLLGYLRASSAQRSALEQAFALLFDNYSHAGSMKTELDHTLLELLILRCRQLVPLGAQTQVDMRVKRAQEFIEENFNRPFAIGDVATAAATSASSLARLFKQQTGATVLGWRDEKRMMHAARLLRSTNLPVSRIAAECGYEEAAFFTRTFKRLLGYTPRQYRQR